MRDCGGSYRSGLEKGREEGLEKGLEKGREEGRIETARRALRVVLDARGLSMSEAERSRIEAERSVETLMEWQRRAVTGASVAEVLAD